MCDVRSGFHLHSVKIGSEFVLSPLSWASLAPIRLMLPLALSTYHSVSLTMLRTVPP